MSCILRVAGRSLAIDQLVEVSSLQPYRVDRKGQRGASSRIATTDGAHFLVSDCDFRDLDGQVRDAISFLQTNERALRAIVASPGVELSILDFGIAWRDVAVQVDHLPAELLRLAGEGGISVSLSHYPVSEVEQQSAAGA